MRAVALDPSSRVTLRELVAMLQGLLVPLSLALFAAGLMFEDYSLAVVGVLCLYAANVMYGCLNLQDRLLFLFLHAGMALFLLPRPVIGLFNSDRAWMLSSGETTSFALAALYLSLMFLFFGAAACDAVSRFNERRKADVERLAPRKVPGADVRGFGAGVRSFAPGLVAKVSESEKIRFIRIAALLCFLVCLAGSFAEGAITLSYMQGLSYEDYYLIDPGEHVPWLVSLLAVMAPYLMCAYLATMPRRAPSVTVMVLHVLTTVPMLIVGSRSDFVISFLFAALYFVFRHVTDKRERWITKRIVAIAVVAVPVGIVSMGLVNYIRADSVLPDTDVLGMFEDAFWKQGVTFTVLGYAYDVNAEVQNLGFKFFSIGSFVSNITQGFIGQVILGLPSLPSGNSAEVALHGNEYAHTMSYFAHPNYLGGEGWGSSYILELFADFGYAGIAVGSFLIACAFFLLSRSVGRGWFWGMVALIGASNVFHMPRGYAIEWISFIWTTRFLGAMVLLLCVAGLLAFASQVGPRVSRLASCKEKVYEGTHGSGKGFSVVNQGIALVPSCSTSARCDNGKDATFEHGDRFALRREIR